MPAALAAYWRPGHNLAVKDRVLSKKVFAARPFFVFFYPCAMAIQSLNPYTGQVVQQFPAASAAELAQILTEAHQAAAAWRKTSFAERATVLRQVGELDPAAQAEVEAQARRYP
ncbi:MAG: aldehyde dehydrogenase, partial [Cytophagaceae bacterium]